MNDLSRPLSLVLWKNVSHLFCQCLPILVCLIVPLDETEILYDSSIPHDRWSVRPHIGKELNNSHCLVMSQGSEVVGMCISPVFMVMLV